MFSRTSRYARASTVVVGTTGGRDLLAIRLPVRDAPTVRRVVVRTEGQRLDHLAAHHLSDATAFWRLCDASRAVAPDALSSRAQVAVPEDEGPR